MYPQDSKNPNPNTHVRLTNIYRYYHDAMLDKWLTKTACIVQPTFLKVLTAFLDSNLVFVSPRQIQQVHKVGVFFISYAKISSDNYKKNIKRVFTELTISQRAFS